MLRPPFLLLHWLLGLVFVGKGFGGQPNFGTAQEFAQGRAQDAAPTEVANRGEWKSGREKVRRGGAVTEPVGSEVQATLVLLRCVGQQRGIAVVLPQAPVQGFHLVGQQRDFVKGCDETPMVDLGLGDPTEVAEFPELDLCPGEAG